MICARASAHIASFFFSECKSRLGDRRIDSRRLAAAAIQAEAETAGYVSFHGRRYSRRRNSFGSVTVPPDPLIVLVTRILAPS